MLYNIIGLFFISSRQNIYLNIYWSHATARYPRRSARSPAPSPALTLAAARLRRPGGRQGARRYPRGGKTAVRARDTGRHAHGSLPARPRHLRSPGILAAAGRQARQREGLRPGIEERQRPLLISAHGPVSA